MRRIKGNQCLLFIVIVTIPSRAFVVTRQSSLSVRISQLCMTGIGTGGGGDGGDGVDREWAKALFESSGKDSGAFEKEMKMKGLMKRSAESDLKQSQNANLVSWLEQAGVYLSDQSNWGEAPHPLAISVETKDEITNECSGRGLLARRDINDGDELIRIPLDVCFTKATARKVLGREIISSGMNEYLAIALFLIREKFLLKSKSVYKAYMDVLPEVDEVNPTFTWNDDDLSYLEGSPVIAATKSLQMKLRLEYDALLAGEDGILSRYPDRFPANTYSFENWIWAFVNLFSRAIRLRNIRGGEILAMVPYADLVNHSPFSNSFIDARESGDWLFKNGAEEVVLYADRQYRRMEQVYISYGPKSNAELLLLYGFAVERNPFNSVDVTVSIAPRDAPSGNDNIPVDPLAEEKVSFLASVGRDRTVDFPCYADRYPVEMLEYLRLMQMTLEDTKGTPLSQFDYTRTISAANEAAVLSSVIFAIKRQLSKYPQSEEEDAALIKEKTIFRRLSYNQRMAVRHRRNEKRLLKRTIAALEKQITLQGLNVENLARAYGITLGQVLPYNERKFGMKQKTALEERLEKLGLPVELK